MRSPTTPTEAVLAALRAMGAKVRRSGDGWSCTCPTHADMNPSLSIGTGDDGRCLLHSHAGCDASAIVAALGLTMRDLMPG